MTPPKKIEAPKAEPITLYAIESDNLDTVCYRGSAPLAVLAQLSKADVFDQVTNPDGLQRDLLRKHALDAYDYANRDRNPDRPRAFPEVVLNVRDKKVLKVADANQKWGSSLPLQMIELVFDAAKIEAAKTVKISRVDGNHRLYFGNGDGKDRLPLDVLVPFQIHVGLSREQEGALFIDINAEQKGLNSSHLHTLRSTLTADDVELELHPARAFSSRLAQDVASPWCELVYMGGSRAGAKAAGQQRPVSFVALEAGIKRMLRSEYLATLTDRDAQYKLIRSYWQAVQQAFPAGFAESRDHLMLKNVSIQALSTFGVKVINRAMMQGHVDTIDLIDLVKPGVEAITWTKNSPDLAGMSGNQAALVVAGRMEATLPQL